MQNIMSLLNTVKTKKNVCSVFKLELGLTSWDAGVGGLQIHGRVLAGYRSLEDD